MNLLPLLLVATLGFGLSCSVFILRERLQGRKHEPAPVTPRRHADSAHFPVSRLKFFDT